jgi:hypothetical protein
MDGEPTILLESKVKGDLGSSSCWGFVIGASMLVDEPVAVPLVVIRSSGAAPREDEDPTSGISFLAWKFRGLRPLTTIGAVEVWQTLNLTPFAEIAVFGTQLDELRSRNLNPNLRQMVVMEEEQVHVLALMESRENSVVESSTG